MTQPTEQQMASGPEYSPLSRHDAPSAFETASDPTRPSATASSLAPVLLVHGWNAHARSLRPIREHLTRSGWPDAAVFCLDFRDTHGSNVTHAAEIAAAVERLRDRTGAPLVDIVAHSMGGLATRWFIAFSPEPAPVRSVVFIATPHRGTWTSLLAWGDSAAELRPDSDFLRTLQGRPFPHHIRTFTVRTRIETHVLPAVSTHWPGALADRLVTFPPHAFLPRSLTIARLVRSWLAQPAEPHEHDGFKGDRMPATRETPPGERAPAR